VTPLGEGFPDLKNIPLKNPAASCDIDRSKGSGNGKLD